VLLQNIPHCSTRNPIGFEPQKIEKFIQVIWMPSNTFGKAAVTYHISTDLLDQQNPSPLPVKFYKSGP
jgi:hypothetical protein